MGPRLPPRKLGNGRHIVTSQQSRAGHETVSTWQVILRPPNAPGNYIMTKEGPARNYCHQAEICDRSNVGDGLHHSPVIAFWSSRLSKWCSTTKPRPDHFAGKGAKRSSKRNMVLYHIMVFYPVAVARYPLYLAYAQPEENVDGE